jgi:hypothetical protein
MTDIGSEVPAWLAVPNARTGETPAMAPTPATSTSTSTDSGPDSGAGAVPGPHAGGDQDAAGGVESALSPLARLTDAPVSEHVGIFEDVLTGLEAVLTSVDEPLPDSEQ